MGVHEPRTPCERQNRPVIRRTRLHIATRRNLSMFVYVTGRPYSTCTVLYCTVALIDASVSTHIVWFGSEECSNTLKIDTIHVRPHPKGHRIFPRISRNLHIYTAFLSTSLVDVANAIRFLLPLRALRLELSTLNFTKGLEYSDLYCPCVVWVPYASRPGPFKSVTSRQISRGKQYLERAHVNQCKVVYDKLSPLLQE